jgi:DNA-binding NtrC family response regulator
MNRPVCIIDDDEDIRGVLAFALEFENIDAIFFESCQLAEEYLSKVSVEKLPCLMVIDYMMPNMNGVDFINLIKAQYPDTIGKIPMALSTGFFADNIENLPPNIIKLEKPIELEHFLKLAKDHYLQPEKPLSFF